MTALYGVLGLVLVQRLCELWLAARNTRRLLAAGAIEIGAGHYPLFILLHGSWLLTILLIVPAQQVPNWWLLGLFLLLQLARVWVVASLGRFWTTRIISVPDAPLVRRGPYRWFRHPNYLVVVGEIAVLPLAFGAWPIALAWATANALLLRHRIRLEDRSLAARAGGQLSAAGSGPG